MEEINKLYLGWEQTHEYKYSHRDTWLEKGLLQILKNRKWIDALIVEDWRRTNSYYKVFFNLCGETHEIWFTTNKYFKGIHLKANDDLYPSQDIIEQHIIHNNIIKDPTSLSIISFIIEPSILKNIKTPYIYPKFIKWFFKHIKDILYWSNKYQIVEVFSFIENMLTLRSNPTIKLISNYDYIKLNGGAKFIDKFNDLCDISVNYNSQLFLDDYNKYNAAHPEHKYEDSIKYYCAKKYNRDNKAQLEIIQQRKYYAYFDILDHMNEIDLSLLFDLTQTVYSHFLWIYTEKLKHTYKFIRQTLPNIHFYNEMCNIAKQLPDKLSKMLTANLHILYQNV